MKKKILITGGKVHDVGYGLFLMREVRKIGIPNHYAENVTAGGKQTLEVFIGSDEKQYTAFVNFIKENYPPKAKVSEVKETSEIPDRVMPVDEYDKLLSAEQQDTIVQSGLEMLDKQDQALNILKDIKSDTSGIPGIDSNTGEMKETLALGISEIISIK